MKTSRMLAGFVLVALFMGALEWHDRRTRMDADSLIVSPAQQAFVRQEIAGARSDGSAYQQALSAWIDEEILYREGLKLGLEKDDLIVKRRVVQKMRFMLEDLTPIQAPTQAQLQTWLDRHPERYRSERAFRFQHLFYSRGKRGDEALFQARQALALLRAGTSVTADPFPLDAGQRLIGEHEITSALGSAFLPHLIAAPQGEWAGPYNSSLGVHLIRVDARDNGHALSLAEAASRVRTDLAAAQREAVNQATVAALRSKYHVVISP